MRRAGFTLVELVIVFTIALLMFSLIGTLSTNTYPKSQLRSNALMVAQTLREAQTFTISQKHDSVWGVHIAGGTMTLFAGTTYLMRNALYDRAHLFPSGISISGLTDVVFEALRGTTLQSGTITLTSVATSETITVTINQNGNVSY